MQWKTVWGLEKSGGKCADEYRTNVFSNNARAASQRSCYGLHDIAKEMNRTFCGSQGPRGFIALCNAIPSRGFICAMQRNLLSIRERASVLLKTVSRLPGENRSFPRVSDKRAQRDTTIGYTTWMKSPSPLIPSWAEVSEKGVKKGVLWRRNKLPRTLPRSKRKTKPKIECCSDYRATWRVITVSSSFSFCGFMAVGKPS